VNPCSLSCIHIKHQCPKVCAAPSGRAKVFALPHSLTCSVYCAALCSAQQALYRSRSAPREEAATRRHIERMHGSPTRTAAVAAVAGRESILGSQQQQQAAVWSGQRDRSRHISAGSSRSSAAFSSPNARKVCVTCVLWQDVLWLPCRLFLACWKPLVTQESVELSPARIQQQTVGVCVTSKSCVPHLCQFPAPYL
jgi:hypothetical protein